MGHQFAHAVVVMDAAGIEHHRPVAELVEKEQIVADDDQGAGKVAQQVDEDRFLSGIEVGGRLVEDQHLRPHRQQPGQGGPLLLAVTQGVGRLADQIEQADLLQGPLGGDLRLPGRQPLVAGAEGDILQQAVAEQLIVRVLEEQADLQPGLSEMRPLQGPALVEDLAPVGPQQAAQLFDQGRLAGAVVPHQRQPVTGSDRKVDSLQGLVPAGIGIVQAAQGEQGFSRVGQWGRTVEIVHDVRAKG